MKKGYSLVVVGNLMACGIFFWRTSGIAWRDQAQVLSLLQQLSVLLQTVWTWSHALYLLERTSSMKGTLRRMVFCKQSGLICRWWSAYCVYRIALSDKGWTNNFIAAQWFKKCFLLQVMARNMSKKMILLIYSWHKSHEMIELHETAVQH